ncbi:MAG: OmpA family protein [Paludibacteraceae bacterium]|nr:OmpA family protein [Paludibacteraceae bacterium]
MKNYKRLVLLTAVAAMLSVGVNAQEVNNSLYFLDNAPTRHYVNPASQPESGFYLSLPVLGWTQFGFGNNSLTLSDVIYNRNGETVTFLHKNGSKNDFYDALRNNFMLGMDARINVLSFGWRTKKDAYWHVGISERVDGSFTLSQDVFKLLLYGMTDKNGNLVDTQYNLKTFGGKVNAFTEVGIGYSKKTANDKWNFGGTLKLLVGQAHVDMTNSKFKLNAAADRWTLDADGSINIAAPLEVKNYPQILEDDAPELEVNYLDEDKSTSDKVMNLVKPHGYGAAIDLGASFRPTNFLEVSVALLDLGGIYWSREVQNLNYKVNGYNFTGADIDHIKDIDTDTILDNMKDAFVNNLHKDESAKSFFSSLVPKLNVGVEVYTPNKLIGASVLSYTKLINNRLFEEVSVGANFRPANWFNLSASYAITSAGQSTIGAAMGLRGGPFNLTIVADYVPMSFASAEINDKKFDYVPYKSKGFNFGVGLNLVFGNKKDKDRDGVKDRKDECPDTPRGVKVDEKGCPLDTDGDGVPDYLDKCSDTPAAAYGLIDENGCPLDTDGDGVPDYLDQCPDTPEAAYGQIDEHGCPLDTDGDGVPDYLDQCPNTLPEARNHVDANGCILDSDGDGVPDYLDQCPNTPAEAYNSIDEHGCPIDSDGDGVPDYQDQCPNTPAEAKGMVDEHGCPRDSDGDGIVDYLDKCPTVAGVKSNNGCPEIKREVRNLFKKALQGIQFETGKSVIKKTSYGILDQIAQVLQDNPTYLIEIQGHTDNVGKDDMNQKLSEARANAVRDYLIGKGVAAERMTAKGYGPFQPVADNKTASGRAKNRRVEFIVSFEEVTYETVTE